jgi:2,3-bisphosphoglycerate-independent phosphoglycerate mutase
MVGHTGHFDATVMAVEAVDLQLARLRRVVDALDGVLVVTADHGNADEMFQRGKGGAIERDKVTGVPVAKTSHTLAPVPLAIHDRHAGDRYALDPAGPRALASPASPPPASSFSATLSRPTWRLRS